MTLNNRVLLNFNINLQYYNKIKARNNQGYLIEREREGARAYEAEGIAATRIAVNAQLVRLDTEGCASDYAIYSQEEYMSNYFRNNF